MKKFLTMVLLVAVLSPVSGQASVVETPTLTALTAANFLKQIGEWTREIEQWQQDVERIESQVKSVSNSEWDGSLNMLSQKRAELSTLRSDFQTLKSRDDRSYVQSLIYAGDIDGLKAQTRLNESLEQTNKMLEGNDQSMVRIEQALSEMQRTAKTSQGSDSKSLQESLQLLNMQMMNMGTILSELAVSTVKANEFQRMRAENDAATQALEQERALRAAKAPPARKPIDEKEMEYLIMGHYWDKNKGKNK